MKHKQSISKTFFAFLTSLIFIFAFTQNASAYSSRNPVHATGTVYRVIDGDTYQINIDSNSYNQIKKAAGNQEKRLRHMIDQYESIRVRLANVNTDESVHSDKSKNTAIGKQISDEIKKLIEKKDVDLLCYDFGNHGRAVCSMTVHGNEGNFDMGAYLIQNGYSSYVRSWGDNPFYHEKYKSLSQ